MTFIDGWFVQLLWWPTYREVFIFLEQYCEVAAVSVQPRTLSKRRSFDSLPWPPNSFSILWTYGVGREWNFQTFTTKRQIMQGQEKSCEWNGVRVLFDVISLFLIRESKRCVQICLNRLSNSVRTQGLDSARSTVFQNMSYQISF